MNTLDRLDRQLQGWLDILPQSQTVSFDLRLGDLRALLDVARAAQEVDRLGTRPSLEDLAAALAPLLEDTQ